MTTDRIPSLVKQGRAKLYDIVDLIPTRIKEKVTTSIPDFSITREQEKDGTALSNDSFSISSPNVNNLTQQEIDAYNQAVQSGDMETAQQIVNKAAENAGYTTNSDYQGTSAFNGSVPV